MASPLQQFLLCQEDGPRASAVKINKKQNLVFVGMVRLQIGDNNYTLCNNNHIRVY